MRRLLILLMPVLLITGCMKAEMYPYFGEKVHANTVEYYKNYVIGRELKANVGDPIVQVKEFRLLKTDSPEVLSPKNDLILDGDFTKKGFIPYSVRLNYKSGSIIPIVGNIWLNGNKYLVADVNDGDKRYGILIDNDLNLFADCILNDDHDYFMPVSAFRLKPSTSFLLLYNTTKKDEIPGIMYELLFSGVNNTSLNVVYREFSGNDLARPAFFQQLTYRTDADTIKFKNILIKLYNVTSQSISYAVLEDGITREAR